MACVCACEGHEQVHTFVFRLNTDSACKHLWKCAVDHHVFFRLSQSTTQQTQSASRSSSSIFRRSRRSIERHPLAATAVSLTRCRDMHVKRRPSQRFPPRRSTSSNVNTHQNHYSSVPMSRRSSTDAILRYAVVTRRLQAEHRTGSLLGPAATLI